MVTGEKMVRNWSKCCTIWMYRNRQTLG